MANEITLLEPGVDYYRFCADEPMRAEMKIAGDAAMIRPLYDGLATGALVPVDRARFERLRVAADAARRVSQWSTGAGGETDTHWCMLPPDWMDTVAALLPTDTDPLPEE